MSKLDAAGKGGTIHKKNCHNLLLLDILFLFHIMNRDFSRWLVCPLQSYFIFDIFIQPNKKFTVLAPSKSLLHDHQPHHHHLWDRTENRKFCTHVVPGRYQLRQKGGFKKYGKNFVGTRIGADHTGDGVKPQYHTHDEY